MINVISGGPPEHDPVSEYEPKDLSPEELEKAGLTLLNVNADRTLVWFECHGCKQPFGVFLTGGGELPRNFRCPWTRRAK